ncbi:hypothetical protein BJ138DRAFT_1152371 [Hygrophoropsis aurantiaca]|uniref:Uncharacterized protein n=1 Tax=Hygrophoropsis aurantiaca TaxID=72124 RepID=A0ACB8ABL3_9AGAM|nr:hypothetical protein BJ138DRAFT_1152371 [Hygrophoropsis aurantiaca]
MMFLSQGHTEEELPGLRKQWDENCNDFFKSWDVKYKIVGRKPKPGDTFTVFQIPGSQHAIRIWDGGMDSCGLFFLDYYDVEKGVPVNTPHGYEIYPVEIPGVLTLPGPLRSLEYACQNLRPDEIYDGREKFCVSKGSHWRLVREGHSDVLFATPTYAEGLPTQYVTGKLCQSLPH